MLIKSIKKRKYCVGTVGDTQRPNNGGTRSAGSGDTVDAVADDDDVEGTVSRDDLFEILSNRRRRYVLHLLKNAEDGRADLSEVAEQIAAWEHDTTPEQLSYDQRRSVRTALYQHHAPKMDETGVVEFHERDQVFKLSEGTEQFDVYLEPSSGEPPWGVYFPLLTAVCAVAVGVGWLGVVDLPGMVWSVFLLAVFGTSSLAFLYDTRYRMRLGSGETPPEVDHDEG
jgi:hypothetical protein